MNHLTPEERYQIYTLKSLGQGINAISRTLGRAKSTISEEIKRNTGGRGYRPRQAHASSQARRSLANSGPSKLRGDVLTYIETKIKAQWSPEQVSGRLMLEKGIAISHEAIYQYVGRDRQNGGQLYMGLRQSQRVYKKRYGKKSSRGKLKNRRDIDERPSAVEKRKEIGHWEIDTVKRYDVPGHFVTLVERKTRLTLIAEVPSLHADIVSTATISLLTNIRSHVKSITSDNGKEFANHEEIAAKSKADFYFAKPYHSWERGTNENTNGLIRQYSPKRQTKFDVRRHSALEIEQKLNSRPRKTLNYLTPNELFLEETGYSMIYE